MVLPSGKGGMPSCAELVDRGRHDPHNLVRRRHGVPQDAEMAAAELVLQPGVRPLDRAPRVL